MTTYTFDDIEQYTRALHGLFSKLAEHFSLLPEDSNSACRGCLVINKDCQVVGYFELREHELQRSFGNLDGHAYQGFIVTNTSGQLVGYFEYDARPAKDNSLGSRITYWPAAEIMNADPNMRGRQWVYSHFSSTPKSLQLASVGQQTILEETIKACKGFGGNPLPDLPKH